MIQQIERLIKSRGLSWSWLEEKIKGKKNNALKREITPKCEQLEQIAKELDCTIILVPNEFINPIKKQHHDIRRSSNHI